MRTDILQQAQAIRASMDAAALEPWQAGTSYAKGAAFVHNGAVYFARQAVVSAEHQQPGSTGMEAIYQAWRKAPAFRHGDISHTLFPRKETFLVLH